MTEMQTLTMWYLIFSRAAQAGYENESGIGQAAAMFCLLLRDATKSLIIELEDKAAEQ